MTKSKFNTKQLVLAALCVALGVVLPVAFHSIPNAGSVLLPMHIPVLLCGLVCGPVYGLLSGILTPLLSSMITGMPPMAYLPGMLCELAAYGLVSGVLWHKAKHTVPMMYASLVTAMVAGRLVWGAVRFVRRAHRPPCIRRDERAHLLRRKLFLRGICFGRVRNGAAGHRHPARAAACRRPFAGKGAAGGKTVLRACGFS